MYIPKHFEETRPQILRNLMHQYPLATVVTQNHNELNANHVPLLLCDADTPIGKLQGHVARANPLLNDIAYTQDVLLIFQGADAYISPSWYEEKAITGKVVPTWNYLAVHVYGKISPHEDPDWLRAHLENLTEQHESDFPTPWQLADAPSDYINRMLRGIVGIEIVIDRIIGKWKLSQNKAPADQQAIAEGLSAQARPDSAALSSAMISAMAQEK